MHTNNTMWQTNVMEVYTVSDKRQSNVSVNPSDEQAVRKNLSKQFDHEFANEPLSEAEKLNNKKTKKRQ